MRRLAGGCRRSGDWASDSQDPTASALHAPQSREWPGRKLRVTKGTFIRSRKDLHIIDDYSVRSSAHRLLSVAWTRTIEFRVSDDDIVDIIDKDDKVHEKNSKSIVWADLSSAAE